MTVDRRVIVAVWLRMMKVWNLQSHCCGTRIGFQNKEKVCHTWWRSTFCVPDWCYFRRGLMLIFDPLSRLPEHNERGFFSKSLPYNRFCLWHKFLTFLLVLFFVSNCFPVCLLLPYVLFFLLFRLICTLRRLYIAMFVMLPCCLRLSSLLGNCVVCAASGYNKDNREHFVTFCK